MASRKEVDPGWSYGTAIEGTKNSVLCNFCAFVSKGGITRHKHHLAGDSPDVSRCPKVSDDVKELFKQHFANKKKTREMMSKVPHFDDVVDLEEEEEVEELTSGVQTKGKRPLSSVGSSAASTGTKKAKGPTQTQVSSFYAPSTTTGKKGGNVVGSVDHQKAQKKLRLDAVQKFARWMYDAGLPFNAVRYDSLGPALEAVARYGCAIRTKPPSYHEVRVPMLQLELKHTKELLKENEVEKATYGCSLMADGWRDRKGRALINFLVNTPRGSMFIESVDASSYSHTGENMFKLFDRFITKVGPESVIQIITDSVSNNVSAGKLVEEKYPHIYWTPCAAHCIDLIFEDIFKLPHLKRTLERAIAVNTYIYNRTLLLNMMREFTGNKEMVRPAKTRFATAFITLSCFKENKKNLRKMFISEQWSKSKFAKEAGGKQTAYTIMLPSFWKNVTIVVKVGYPLLDVLRLVDGERKPPMGYIYEAMDRAKELIAKSFNNNEGDYQRIFEIIDRRWDCQLHRPLHAAGYYLNPSLYYNNPAVEDDSEVVGGFMECVTKLALNEEEQMKIHAELPLYCGAEGLFGNPMAKKMRANLAPAKWWKQYGASAPTLKKFAIKVLSLTCSSSGCERNWSVFEHLHSKKRNRLEQKKLNDLIYIKYNRALRRRYDMRDTTDPIILDDTNVEDPKEWLRGSLGEEEEDEEDALVVEGEDLTWGDVAAASGAGEAAYSTRAGSRGSNRGDKTSTSKSSARGGKASSRSKERCLIDEDSDDFDEDAEENDVAAYKDYVPTLDGEDDDDDEAEYEDLDR